VHATIQSGATPLIFAAQCNAPDVAQLLLDSKADVHAKQQNGYTALHLSAQCNTAAVATKLIARGADVNAKNNDGYTPLDLAKHFRSAIVMRVFPGGEAYIKEQGKKELGLFMAAKKILVLSVRFAYPPGQNSNTCCDPKEAATLVKQRLQLTDGVLVFDPNSDNAYIMLGDANEANSIWLKNWRLMLKKAKETNGAVVQVIVNAGNPSYPDAMKKTGLQQHTSHMQDEEEDMAKDKGVPVIKLDATALRSQLLAHLGVDYNGHDNKQQVAKLEALADKVLPKLQAGVVQVSEKKVAEYKEVVFKA